MLSPYRVLDLTDERGQFASFLLATMGAEVLALEPPGGSRSRRRAPLDPDGLSLAHRAVNRGKRSVTLDPTTAAGRSQLDALAATADILIESGTPAELAAQGIDRAALMVANPGLVVVSISPFGQTGPKAEWASTDLTVWAAGGPLAISGDPDRAPVQVTVPQAYFHAGAVAASGAVLAMLARARTGRGQHVDVSTQVSVMAATQSAVLCASANAPAVARSGGGIKGGDIFLRFVYPASDGHVSITHVFGAAVGPFTARLMQYVYEGGGCDEATRDKDWVAYAMALSDGSEPMAAFEAIKDQVAAFTATRTKAQLFADALERRLLLAPVATTSDVLGSEQLAARDYWDVIDGHRYPGRYARLSATPLLRPGAAPDAGTHTEDVQAELAAGRRPSLEPVAKAGETHPEDRRPLAGLKVLDFMWAVAGPTISRALADAGATVVRVESVTKLDAARAFLPFFDNQVGVENSALYNNLSAGKLGVALNLSKPEAREVALDLVRWADVVCESYSPRAMRAFGLDYESLRAVNPSMVMLSTCLFGQDGPLALFAGFGNLAAAMTGFYNVTGWPDRDPAGPFGAYTDYSSPPVALATLLAAIDHRRRTGEGQYIDFSQAESAVHFLGPAVLDQSIYEKVTHRAGNAHPAMSPHGVFPAAGADRWVAIAAQDDAAWETLAGLIGRAELAGLTLGARLERRAELEELVAAWTGTRTAADAEAACQGVGVAAHQVQNADELAVDPQLHHLGHWRSVAHSHHGDTIVEGPRLRLSDTPIGPTRAAPMLGEHSFEVLADLLGYDPDRIADLAVAEVLE
ncbi:MAG: CoA transferase [Acidimicrobiales bacterium]